LQSAPSGCTWFRRIKANNPSRSETKQNKRKRVTFPQVTPKKKV
jgi:hypothetical protein